MLQNLGLLPIHGDVPPIKSVFDDEDKRIAGQAWPSWSVPSKSCQGRTAAQQHGAPDALRVRMTAQRLVPTQAIGLAPAWGFARRC